MDVSHEFPVKMDSSKQEDRELHRQHSGHVAASLAENAARTLTSA